MIWHWLRGLPPSQLEILHRAAWDIIRIEMPLSTGTRLGPYEILAPLGAGGMGEVYRARDTRLDRTVAVKILPSHLSSDATLRQRFDQEAKAISSLNHPHICALYDVGHQDGTDFLVMEHLEGETLAKLLEKGSLPLAQVLKYGVEIADALDKAHRQGIVHRDLKPGNIMITKSGAKLLDFGLAKAAMPLASGATLTAAVTRTTPVTQPGTVVGTFQYMSPEQVEAKDLDARSDIFSFGAVLYEMVTGQRAFRGKSQLSVASAILEKDPDPISTLQPLTPLSLDHAIHRCLAKDPDDRWQTARDLFLELKWIGEGGSQASQSRTTSNRSALGWRTLTLSALTLLLVAAIAGLAAWNLKPSPPKPVTRAVITLPPGQHLVGLEQPAVALSPDGNQLAYVAIQGGTQQIYLRALESQEARPVPGTEGGVSPFFSPDSQWLGFFSGQKLKKVPVSGGPTQTLNDAAQSQGASWATKEIIAFKRQGVTALQQVPASGGTPQPLIHLENGETAQRWPDFLPSGEAVLTVTTSSSFDWTNTQIVVQSIGTGERRNLIRGGTQPRYAASEHLIYAQGGTLMAVPLDPRRLTVTGAATPMVEGVLQSNTSGAAQYSLSSTGSLVYVRGEVESAQRRLVWVTRNGAEQPVGAPVRTYLFPRLSPDGRTVAVGISERETHLWLYDLARETSTRFTFEGNVNHNPTWTPDGKRIAFNSDKDGATSIYWLLADGSGGLERLTSSPYPNIPMSWSPDGQLLAFMESNPTSGSDIWVLRLSDRKPQPFLATPFSESVPRFSPDGHWLSYISNESGRYEVYVQPYPGPGRKLQISTEGGTEPVWNRNGRELFYRNGDKMMAVDIGTQSGFAAGKPRMLFEGRYERSPATSPNYDVSPDGQRFLMLKADEKEVAAPTQINVVLNWFEELKRRVPTEKK
jgi:serine/threonine protein kinase/Tol biopolymer transport system component